MTLRDALDRTVLLIRDEIEPSVSDDAIVDALKSTHVALVADAANLASHSSQSAFITAALLMARSGQCVHLIAPDVPMIGAQIPLSAGSIITELVNVGADILPNVKFSTLATDKPFDLIVALGDSEIKFPAKRVIRLNATDWSGSIESVLTNARWRAEDWPFGGLAAGALAAIEAFKCSMQRLESSFRNPNRLHTVFKPTNEITYQLAPEQTPKTQTLGAFDCISGGAIIHATIYALARIPQVLGHSRVIEPDSADLSNLNRYSILRRSSVGLPKAEQLACAVSETGLIIDQLDLRYDAKIREILQLAPAVLVGVDDIPTRWEVQRAKPSWLAIGATTHWNAMASFHHAGLGCAECAHPYDDPEQRRIPTVAFVSFWAGLLTAVYFIRHLAGDEISATEQQVFVTPLRAETAAYSPVRVRPSCSSCGFSEEAHANDLGTARG